MDYIQFMIDIYNSFISFGNGLSTFFTTPISVPVWARFTLDMLTLGWFEIVNTNILEGNTILQLVAVAIPIALPVIIVKDIIL